MLSVKLPRSSYTPEMRMRELSGRAATLTAAIVRYQS